MLAIFAVCGSVAAQANAQPSSEAASAFQRGLEQMQARRYDSACPTLGESYRLEPLPSTAFALAECESAWGKTASAVEHYEAFVNAVIAMPPNEAKEYDERRKHAVDSVGRLGPLVAEIAVVVPPGAPAGLVVKRNGVIVEPASYGVSRKVDPGPYVVTAELDGASVWERRITMTKQDRARIEIPWPPSRVGVAAASAAGHSGPSLADPGARPEQAKVIWMFSAAGVGIVGLATGLVSGAVAVNYKNTADLECPRHQCSPAGRRALQSATTAATVSTVTFGLGLVGIGAMVALILSTPEAPSPGPARTAVRTNATLAQGGASFSLEGSF